MKNLKEKKEFSKQLAEKLQGVNISRVARRMKVCRATVYNWLDASNPALPRVDAAARLESAIHAEKSIAKN